jgi:predicted secreted hydrolase
VAIDFTLTPTKPPVLHGNRGLSQKGATAGNASHYYSLTRLATQGTVRVAGETFTVQGSSWMDHEFSTSFLEPGQLGWDWMAIQLDNGVDLMVYRMRCEDGSTDPYSSGSLVDKTGASTHLSIADYQITPGRSWESPETGANYPLEWSIGIPSHRYALELRPAFDAQEMTTDDTTGINYWEGAVEIDGTGPDGPVTGRGYMELTGYTGQGLGSLLASDSEGR